MPQRPLRLTFGPSRSGFFHGQHAGSGFRGRISEAWPHFSPPGAFMHGGLHALCGTPKKNTGKWNKHKKETQKTQFKKSQKAKFKKQFKKSEASLCS